MVISIVIVAIVAGLLGLLTAVVFGLGLMAALLG
jgi:hypothetical protein